MANGFTKEEEDAAFAAFGGLDIGVPTLDTQRTQEGLLPAPDVPITGIEQPAPITPPDLGVQPTAAPAVTTAVDVEGPVLREEAQQQAQQEAAFKAFEQAEFKKLSATEQLEARREKFTGKALGATTGEVAADLLFPGAREVEGTGVGSALKRAGLGTIDAFTLFTRLASEFALSLGFSPEDVGGGLLDPEGNILKGLAKAVGEDTEEFKQFVKEKGGPFADTPIVAFGGLSANDAMKALPTFNEMVILAFGDPGIAVAGVAKGLTNVAKRIIKGTRGLGGRALQFTSGVDKELLNIISQGGKRADAIKAARGKGQEIGEALVTKVNDPDNFLTIKNDVSRALDQMPNVNAEPIIDEFGKHIKRLQKSRVPGKDEAIEEIQKFIALLKDDTIPADLTARELRNLRIGYDSKINWGRRTGATVPEVEKAITDARGVAKRLLEKSGDNVGFGDLMKDYSDAIRLNEKMRRIVGINPESAALNAEKMISNIFKGKFKKSRKDFIKKFDEAFGSDFTEKGQNVVFSEVLEETGQLPLIPPSTTRGGSFPSMIGRGTLAIAGPRAAAGGIIPTGKRLIGTGEQVGPLRTGEGLAGAALLPLRGVGALGKITPATVPATVLQQTREGGQLQQRINEIQERGRLERKNGRK